MGIPFDLGLQPFTDAHGHPVRLDPTPHGGVTVTRITPERDEWVNLSAVEARQLRDMLERYLEWLGAGMVEVEP